MWRHEDVFYVLGGGTDPVTNVRITDPAVMVAKGAGGPMVHLPVAPLMHGATQWCVMGQSFVGSKIVLMAKFDPHDVWRLVGEERVNSVMITGDAMGKPLIESLTDPGTDHDLSSLLAVVSSAALFSAPVKDQFFVHLPNLVITDAIGSSEGGNNGMTVVTAGNTAMKSGPTVHLLGETVVFDENLEPVEPGSGVIGKIARSGDIPLGYYNDPKKTAEVFIEVRGTRYVMPGDYATVEADGSITLLGRGSIVINSGGEKIFPEEVESAVRSHPDVMDAIVCGAPDERWGQTVAAIVQPRVGHEAPSLESLQEHCRQSIAGYKLPRRLYVVDAVERSPSGKPDYTWAAAVVNAGRRPGPGLPQGRSRAELSPQQRLGGRNGGARPATDPTSTELIAARYGSPIIWGTDTRRPIGLRAVGRSARGAASIAAVGTSLLLLAAGAAVAAADAATPASGVAHVDPTTSWTVYHGNPLGTGVDTSGVTFSPPNLAWKSPVLDGQVYGEPLEATGRVFVATENDTIYALAANTGAILWSTHVGTPVPSGDLPCGDIGPTVGITGTPVIDTARGEIFAVADELSGGTPAHVLVGLNIYTGSSLLAQAVDPPGTGTGRDPAAHRAEPEQRQRRLRVRRQRRRLLDLQRLGRLGARGRWNARLLPGGADRPRRGGVDGRRRARGRRGGQHLGGHGERVVVDSLRLQRLGPRAVAGSGSHAVLRPRATWSSDNGERPGPRIELAGAALERDHPAGGQVVAPPTC